MAAWLPRRNAGASFLHAICMFSLRWAPIYQVKLLDRRELFESHLGSSSLPR
jgi:hypothetical protein